MFPNIESLVDAVVPEIVDIRHAVHRNPELALCERETAALIRDRLSSTEVRLLDPFLGTDVVAMLEGGTPGRNVTLRADIDALPLQEKTGLPYASRVAGRMHACGHDGHTAMLIGAAVVLGQLQASLKGSVRFVFQPGEEVAAAGKDLVAKGALRGPDPDAILALHGWSSTPVGTIASKSGCLMAAAEFFKITILGKGAHGSMPQESIDPILVGARVVEALQSIVSRLNDPQCPVVVSVCRFSAGTNGNIIPDCAELEGTVRYLHPEMGDRIPGQIEQVARGICAAAGATCELEYVKSYVPTINDAGVVALGREVARECFGPAGWVELERPSMGGEDFAYYIQDYPGAMFRIGMGENSPSLHSPHFDFNDDALRPGILFLVKAAVRALA